MTITNEEYQATLEVVANREKDLLESAQVFIDELVLDLSTRTGEFQQITSQLPPVVGAPSNSRAIVENAIAQVNSLTSQLNYVKQTIDNGLNAYNPTPIFSMPSVA